MLEFKPDAFDFVAENEAGGRGFDDADSLVVGAGQAADEAGVFETLDGASHRGGVRAEQANQVGPTLRAEVYPGFAGYAEKTKGIRTIPVLALRRR
ncbi:hypothetical protein OH799_25970 [Nocardia sp. NBC_00881]|nr:hypothetical protein OH799_25970 [Nocardia sp. NBC_00881]